MRARARLQRAQLGRVRGREALGAEALAQLGRVGEEGRGAARRRAPSSVRRRSVSRRGERKGGGARGGVAIARHMRVVVVVVVVARLRSHADGPSSILVSSFLFLDTPSPGWHRASWRPSRGQPQHRRSAPRAQATSARGPYRLIETTLCPPDETSTRRRVPRSSPPRRGPLEPFQEGVRLPLVPRCRGRPRC